jgi:hypothetical protein
MILYQPFNFESSQLDVSTLYHPITNIIIATTESSESIQSATSVMMCKALSSVFVSVFGTSIQLTYSVDSQNHPCANVKLFHDTIIIIAQNIIPSFIHILFFIIDFLFKCLSF